MLLVVKDYLVTMFNFEEFGWFFIIKEKQAGYYKRVVYLS